MPEDSPERLSFLFKAMDDNQATIRFLDTKAAFGIAVLGAMLGKVLDRDQLIACESHGFIVMAFSAAFAASVVLSAILGYKTIFPTINPAKNVSFPDDLDPKFFIHKLRPRRLLRLFSSSNRFAMLETTHVAYCEALKEATQAKLESIVAAEVLKLSFIRQLKMDRLSAFASALIVTVVLFIFVMFEAPKVISQKLPPSVNECPPVSTPTGPRDIYNYAPVPTREVAPFSASKSQTKKGH
jgi:hypothetical protein